MRRLLKLIALAGAGYGLWRLLTAGDPEPAVPPEAPQPAQTTRAPEPAQTAGDPEPAEAAQTPQPADAPRPIGPPADEGSLNDAAAPPLPPGATKAELYERAKQLGIEGRSKMSKAQLERAIGEAG